MARKAIGEIWACDIEVLKTGYILPGHFENLYGGRIFYTGNEATRI